MAQTFSPADFETASQEPLKFSPEDFSSTSTITQQFTPEDFSSDRRTIPTIADTTKGGAPLSLPETALQSTLGEIGEAAGESLSRKEGIGSVLPRLSLTPQDVRGIILDVSPPEGIERSKVEALPPTTLEKVVSGTTQGIEELAKGVADFFTTPSGIAQLGAAVTPIAPAVYAKWTLDMVNAGFTSVQDAVDAYKKSDYARLSKDATVAFGSFLGAAAAAKKGYYELTPILETMPRGDLRGVRVEEAQQKALEATLPKALVESGAPMTAKAVTELPKVPLLSEAQAEAGLFEKIPEAAANVDIRGLAGERVKRPLTEAEATSGLNEILPVDETTDIRRRPIELTGGSEKVQGQSVSQLESRVESEIGKEGARGSLRADWAEINADIESGMTREAALQKYVDELDASRARSDAEELARNKSYLETDEAKSAAMTPEEYKEKVMRPIYDRLVKEFKPKKKGQQPADFENWFKIGGNQENIIGNAVIRDAPINAKAAERFGIEDQLVEQGYVRDGDLYVKKSKKGGPDAIQKQSANEEVLGNEVQGAEPQLGLRPMGEGNKEPQAVAGTSQETLIKKGGSSKTAKEAYDDWQLWVDQFKQAEKTGDESQIRYAKNQEQSARKEWERLASEPSENPAPAAQITERQKIEGEEFLRPETIARNGLVYLNRNSDGSINFEKSGKLYKRKGNQYYVGGEDNIKAHSLVDFKFGKASAISEEKFNQLKKGGDQNETQKEKGRQEVLAPTAGETKAGDKISNQDPRLLNDSELAAEIGAMNESAKPFYDKLESIPEDDLFIKGTTKYSPQAKALNDSIAPFAERKRLLQHEFDRRAMEEGNKKITEGRDKRVAEAPVFQRRNGWEIVKEGVDYVLRDPATKEDVYRGKLSRVREVADESKPEPNPAPKIEGMGGAIPSEFTPSQAMPTANKNASIDADRVARGEAPLLKAMRKTDPELWDQAMSIIDRDWYSVDNLIAELKEKPRIPQDFELIMLLRRRVDLKNEFAKLSREYHQAIEEGRPEASEATRASRDAILEQLQTLESMLGRGDTAAGTMAGRALRARQLMMNEDYSMASLIVDRQARLGRKLTEPEIKELQKISDEAMRKNAELERRVEELQKQAEEVEANAIIEQAAHDAVRVPKASSYVIDLAEKIVADWDKRADRARERLKEKFKRTNVGLDPTIIVDLAEIGLSHLGHAGLNFAKWSAKMLDEFKELDATDLKEVYEKSQELADADIAKRAPKEKVSAVKKTITQVSKDLVKSTVERAKKNVAKNPDFNISFAARKLAREFWIRGIRDPQKMVDAVHEALKEAIPELERRETMDALSGYGKFKPLSKDEVSVGLRDINGQLQQIAKLEDMAQGQAPKKSGFERRAPSDEERRLIKQVEEKKKEGGYDVTDPETQLRTAMQAAERRLENEISDLEHQIETRTKIVKDRRKLVYDDKLQGLKDRRDFLKSVFNDIFKKPELTDAERLQQWKERTQEKIDDYQEQVVSGYFKQRKRPEPIRYDPEAIKLRYELNKVHRAVLDMRLKDELAKRNMAQKIAGGVGNTLRFVRAVMTGGEFSGVLRQGGFLFGAHPVIGAKALKQMFQALMSEEAQFKIMEEIQTRPNAPLYERSKLDFTDAGTRLSSMEEHYMFRVAESVKSIPGVKQGVKILDAFQRAYTTYLNEIRADAFDKLVDTYGNDKVTTEQIANYINVATGRGSRAVGRWTGPGMNTIFFAPRYSISRLQLLTGQPMWHGNVETRKMVAKEYARALSSVAVVYSLGLLWGKANNQSAEETIQTDPRSSDFGKIKIGNSRIDPLAGLAQWTALMAREVSGTTVNSRGKVRPLRENYRMGGHLPKRTIVEDNGLEVAERFGITKLAPGPSSVARFLAGEDFTGQKFTFANELLNAGMPITYGDIYKAMREQGVPNGTAMAILSIFGMGLQTYDVNKRKQ